MDTGISESQNTEAMMNDSANGNSLSEKNKEITPILSNRQTLVSLHKRRQRRGRAIAAATVSCASARLVVTS